MNEDELVVDKQRATNHLGSEVARHQPVRGIGSLGFDSRRLQTSSDTPNPRIPQEAGGFGVSGAFG